MPTANRRVDLKMVKGAESGGVAVQDKYRAIFEQSSDAIATVREDGRFDDVNHAFEELTGFLSEELSDGVGNLTPDPKTSGVPARARPFSREFLAVPGTYEDVAFKRKDGIIRLVDLSVRRVAGPEGELALLLLRDMSERKRMERELMTKHAELKNAFHELEKKSAEVSAMQDTLVQAGKMAALGELAAGIAHELNQPLQAIRGYAQELQYELESARATQQTLAADRPEKEIIKHVDKMAQIIQYLRTHVRKSGEGFEETDVHAAIEESLKMLSRQLAMRGITVERAFDGGLPKVYANPLQLEQVFINLATNARDAIEATGRGSGKIRISTRSVGQLVEIEFSDDGCGMDAKTKQKAFNPFFTTKEVGKGMGMGLSISYGAVAKLQGSIVVESEVGKGTTFRVRIPRDYRELG